MGALTSKPYAFTARPWELRSMESIDFLDSMGSSLRVDVRGLNIMRVLPRINEALNEEWITDKARFSYDAIKRQRISTPLAKLSLVSHWEKISWNQLFHSIVKLHLSVTKCSAVGLVFGRFTDLYSFFSLKTLIVKLVQLSTTIQQKQIFNFVNISQETFFLNHSDLRLISRYRTNYSLPSFSELSEAGLFLLWGVALRWEMPLLNLRLRRWSLSKGISVYSFGFVHESTFEIYSLGKSTKTLHSIVEGRHPLVRVLKSLNKPIFGLYGHSFLRSTTNLIKLLIYIHNRIAKGKLVYLLNSISSFLMLDDSVLTSNIKTTKNILWMHDEDDLIPNFNFWNTVLYIGHHGDRNASISNFVIPSPVPFEKNSLYQNNFANILSSSFILTPPINVRSELNFSFVFTYFVYKLFFIPVFLLPNMLAKTQILLTPYTVHLGFKQQGVRLSQWQTFSSFFKPNYDYNNFLVKFSSVIFSNFSENKFYSDSSITRASAIMALSRVRFKRYSLNFYFK